MWSQICISSLKAVPGAQSNLNTENRLPIRLTHLINFLQLDGSANMPSLRHTNSPVGLEVEGIWVVVEVVVVEVELGMVVGVVTGFFVVVGRLLGGLVVL